MKNQKDNILLLNVQNVLTLNSSALTQCTKCDILKFKNVNELKYLGVIYVK